MHICTVVLFSVIQWHQACTTFIQALCSIRNTGQPGNRNRPAWRKERCFPPKSGTTLQAVQCSSAITQQTTGTACTAAAFCKPTEHTGCHSLATATATMMILTLTTHALHAVQCKHTGHTGCSTTMHSPARHSTGCCLPKHTIVQLCCHLCAVTATHCRCWCYSEHIARLSSYREQGCGSTKAA